MRVNYGVTRTIAYHDLGALDSKRFPLNIKSALCERMAVKCLNVPYDRPRHVETTDWTPTELISQTQTAEMGRLRAMLGAEDGVLYKMDRAAWTPNGDTDLFGFAAHYLGRPSFDWRFQPDLTPDRVMAISDAVRDFIMTAIPDTHRNLANLILTISDKGELIGDMTVPH